MNENKASSSWSTVIASCTLLTISIDISRSTRDRKDKLEGKSSGDDTQREREGLTMAGCVQSRPLFIVFAQNEHGDLPQKEHELIANV